MDAAVYLRIAGMNILIMTLLTLLGFPILIPIFVSGAAGLKDFDEIAISNLGQASENLWAPCIMMWLFTIIASFIIIKNYRAIYKLRLQTIGTGEGFEYTIMITNIPPEFNTEEKIRKDLSEKYPGKIMSVVTIHEESELRRKVDSLSKEHVKLMRAQHVQDLHNGKPTKKRLGYFGFCGYGEIVDPVKFHSQNITTIKAEALRARATEGTFVGVAFVTFNSITAATKAGSTNLSEHPETWIVKPAPKPSDLIWSNIEQIRPVSINTFVIVLKSAALFCICIFWSIPVAFINAFSNLQQLSEDYPAFSFVQDFSPFWKSVITGLVPGVLLVLLMLLLYPVLWNLVKITGVTTYAELDYQFMGDYYMFLVIDVFLITLLSSSIWDTLQDILEHPRTMFELLGKSIPAVAVIMIGYILIQSLIVETERIVRLWFLLLSFVFSSMSKTTVEKQQATKPERFSYGGNLAYSSLIFTICFCYSCISPIILPFGVLYFCVNYLVNKYKLLYTQKLRFETHGKFFPKVANHMFTGMIIAHLALMGVVLLKFGHWQLLILFPLPLGTYLLSSYMYSYYGEDLQHISMPLSAAVKRDTERSDELVMAFLKRWHNVDCWRQSWMTVNLDDPLEPEKEMPTWEDINRNSVEFQLDLKDGGESPREDEPLISSRDNSNRSSSRRENKV